MKRYGGKLNIYYYVKVDNLEWINIFMIPTVLHFGKVNIVETLKRISDFQ